MNPQNRTSAQALSEGPQIAIPGRSEGVTLRTRVDALRTLRQELGEPLMLQNSRGEEASVERVAAFFNSRGDVRSLYAQGANAALLIRNERESFPEAAFRFIRENEALWDLHTTEFGPQGFDTLEIQQVEATQTPKGDQITTVYFQQYWRGLPVIDTDIRAVFWGDRLIKWTGALINSAADWIPEEAGFLSAEEAVLLAEQQLSETGRAVYEADIEGFGVSVNEDRSVYRIKVTAANLEGEEDVVESFDTWLDAQTGELLHSDSNLQHLPSTPANYRVYSPTNSSTTPNHAYVRDRGAHVALNGNQVYPWRDTQASRSPVLLYNSRMVWNASCGGASPCWGFNWQTAPNYNFTANPGSPSSPDQNTNPPTNGDKFRLQHLAYWTQRAVALADINFTWWPPANSAYKHSKVTVLSNRIAPGTTLASVTGVDGCWFENTWRPSDSTVGANPQVYCIKHPMRGGNTYGTGQAITPGVIFHEVGHVIDGKYLSGDSRNSPITGTCTPNTSEEAQSLSETLPGLYAMMATLDLFSSSSNFVDADAVAGALNAVGSLVTGAVVHRGDDDVACHGVGNCSPASNAQHYQYGRALHQAYWEVAHGLNCDGPNSDPCYVLPDSARASEARWALFYAMKNSPKDDSYREFVADFLAYYLNSVSYTAWADRWWVFNHHGLAGTTGSYSPCAP